jgi:uncharacterized protein YkwD
MRKIPVYALLAVLALAGCQNMPSLDAVAARTQPDKPAAPQPPPPDPKTQMAALENRVATVVIEARQKIDPRARTLAIDPELTSIARARAADMAAKNYLAHAAPNGDTSATLLMAADDKFQGLLGENLAAQHYTVATGVDPDAFAQRFLETWLSSAPHKDNLAFADYDRTGVGAAVNGDTVYVAQLFASSLGTRTAGDMTVVPLDKPADAKPGEPGPSDPEPLRLRGAMGGQ